MKLLLLLLVWTTPVWADQIVFCNPADPTVPNRVVRYEAASDPFKTGAVNNPNSLIYSLPASPVNPWNGLHPATDPRYWKCSGSSVLAMTQAEQDAVNAPAVADAALQASYDTEVVGNDLCTATLAEVNSRIETRRTTLRTAIESQRVTNNTTITNAANTVAGVKSAMTTINNATAAEFGQSVDELASLATKLGRCLKARAGR